jgi:hypothetical protein
LSRRIGRGRARNSSRSGSTLSESSITMRLRY